MTDVARIRSVRYGIHASAGDFTTFPSVTALDHIGDGASLLPRSRVEVAADFAASDGRGYPFRWGGKDISPVILDFEFKGVSGNTGAAIPDFEAVTEQGKILQSFFGAVGTATVGAVTTCSGTAGATLTVVSGTNIPNDSIIMFTTTTGTFIRRVISGGGTVTLTLDRAASGTASGNVIRAGVYTAVPSRTAHAHLAVDVEGTTVGGTAWRQRFFGLAPSMLDITFPDTGLVTAKATLNPTDWDQPAAASPAFASPTAGAPIAVAGYTFGDAAIGDLDLANAVLKINNGVAMRATGSGPNGVRGGVAADKREIVLEGEVFMGGSTPSGQMNLANTQAWLGSLLSAGTIATTRALSLQVGTVAGAAVGLFMPAAAVRATVINKGGLQMAKFTAKATGATPFFMGIF